MRNRNQYNSSDLSAITTKGNFLFFLAYRKQPLYLQGGVRLWQQKNEEIFSNIAHCAMAFRLLRMSNYEVSSEELAEFVDEEYFFATNGKLKSHVAICELHKASQLAVDEKDHILDKISYWTGIFMEQKLLNNDFLDTKSKKEVELALMKFYVTYDRVENRRYIQSYEENNFKILKAAYSCTLQHEFSDARLMYAKYTMFLTLIDDLFNVLALKDELLNIIELVERWDAYESIGFLSERVKIFFSAFYNTMEDLAAKAEIRQGRSVKDHLNNLDLLGSADAEIHGLCNCAGTLMRLLNDLQSYKRERAERTSNLVSVLMMQSPGTISEEEAIRQAKEMVEINRRKLLRMVVQGKGTNYLKCAKIFFGGQPKRLILFIHIAMSIVLPRK
ncbi:santalene and bergamotene synthase, chloroplastic [Nicotiana attenuata]|uniref:Santalene and bergamotene synthase, chloroplastic n=1 Tax=Nicotiana attenuata TaxID=49451 RepID=A0A314L7N8_NICAT|nr:santalene and bergamotene synthase, chloroplastic [Nicotiana attenuata]